MGSPPEQQHQSAQQGATENKPHPKSAWIHVQDDPHCTTLELDGVPRILHNGHHNLTWLMRPPLSATNPPAATGVPPRVWLYEDSCGVYSVNVKGNGYAGGEYLSLQEATALIAAAREEGRRDAEIDALKKICEELKAACQPSTYQNQGVSDYYWMYVERVRNMEAAKQSVERGEEEK